LIGQGASAAIGTAVSGGTVAGASMAFNVDTNNRQLHPTQIARINALAKDNPAKAEQLKAVLCVLQNCDLNGLSGYDSNGQTIYETGKQLQTNYPDLFKQLVTEVNAAGLLSGQFAYQPGGLDFTKDAVGKAINDKVLSVKNAYDTLTANPDSLSRLGSGIIKGLANNVKDAPQYPLDGQDEKQGALLANVALIVGPGVAAGVESTLTSMGRAWEASKVLGAGEVTMSSSGNISAQQITRVGTPAALDSAAMTKLNTLDSLSPGAAGTVREAVADSYFQSNGFKAFDGKCGSNCFDGVYVKGDQVIVNEVKPLNADGSIKLNPAADTGLPTQGTIQWVEDRAKELLKSDDPSKVQVGKLVLEAKDSGKLTTTISGINSNGMVIVKVKQ
jgi:filamentous hemagglutinin